MTDRASVSTGVLDSFMAAALADDYAPTGQPRAADAAIRRPVWGRASAIIVAVLIGTLLAALLISTVRSADLRQRTRDELAGRVTAATAAVATQQAVVDAQQARVAGLQGRVLESANLAAGAAVAGLATQAGTAPLTGPGVRIVLDDASGAEPGSENRVLDRDLQDVVNALWREGATGVAINGQRLVATTAIRSAGEAIVVNYQPLERPYRVEAVGAIVAARPDSGVGRLLGHLSRDYGLETQASAADVALPAGELRQPRFATLRPSVDGGQP